MGTACMRWAPGRVQSWRKPEDGGFRPDRYGVSDISERAAREYVLARHYAGTWPSPRLRYGLFDVGSHSLVGAAVLSCPTAKAVLTKPFPELTPYFESLELGRFVLDDEVPANAESWFLAQAFRLAADAGIRGIVSFSDPVPRSTADGMVIMPGHVGTIYQASNALYTGRARPRTLTVLPDGSVFSDRSRQKVIKREQGHEYAERQLIKFGAPVPRAGEQPADWLARALPAARARKLRHRGVHRYLFTLGSHRQRRSVAIALPGGSYPKTRDVAA